MAPPSNGRGAALNLRGDSFLFIETHNRFQILDEPQTPLELETHRLPDEDSYHVEEAREDLEQVRNDFLIYRDSVKNQIEN